MKLARSPLAPERFPDLPNIAGVEALTFSLGMYGYTRDDLLVVRFPERASCGGVFTRSLTRSCDVDWCREALEGSGGVASALIVNAGNSNAFTFEKGVAKNEATLDAYEAVSKMPRNECYIAATGVIGVPVEPDLIAKHLPTLWPDLAPNTPWLDLAKAFSTTDTYPKGAGRQIEIDGRTISIAGIAKGSGMIAPNMATMLAYIFTDAPLTPQQCQELTSRHANASFNCITVDGDTSTSDTVMMFATGAAPVSSGAIERELDALSDAIGEVFMDLAHQIVRDGEGATKFVEVSVTGATSETSAKIIACSVANSPLVKTALAANDANWGRIVMAVGKAMEPVNRDKLVVDIGDVRVAEGGARAATYDEARATAAVSGPNISIKIDVAMGESEARVWTCDLTHGYVEINGAYRT
ncbi:bifunctional glutamate N-acetyltransferase/amino-acid acetyltransferase ArgJ [Ponticaulis sp.]|uniref:bifunctional glutamate N-acetyltransferase/amino-acid acetyltransferase ArgJ n=1 Tax=Ponticaulis sp. TaxID=2020902 RepID=UPI000B74AEF5|nr:bifunctional glutamate N-acetyltransferase/amino-acid acetyltransferase ArgJ [Ponticaulis sp.]MAI90152.1 bifunctional ornithine acetyltransferase/N-acetylglutamate synthase [Ponticaulis sp.]OUX99804.1 MAG: bifunctional ornithine acetyltransferase/N-acetylglutamate synthase [Hyphomonadaceae bacterium TMED5]